MHHLIYHANCADGFAAACIARHALLNRGEHPDVLRFHPVTYDDHNQLPLGDAILRPFDQVTYLDYTPPQDALDTLTRLHDGTVKLTILDHHETAAPRHGYTKHPEHAIWEQTTQPPFDSIFRFTQSGAGLAWSHWFPDHAQPYAVTLIEHRDLGHAFQQPDHPHTRPALDLHAYLFRCLPRTFEAWTLLGHNPDLREPIVAGCRLRIADAAIIDAAVRHCHWLDFSHLSQSPNLQVSPSGLARIPAVNGLDAGLISDACTALLKAYPSAPFAASWFINAKTGHAVYSLRSRKQDHPDGHVNVAQLAAACDPGGGGHPCAAGFHTSTPIPFAP